MNQNNPIDPSHETGSSDFKNKIANPSHWLRLLLMGLMFIILFYLINFIVSITMVVQWILVLFSGETNARLQRFSKGLNRYAYQILEFISFNSKTRPFPLSDWPESND